jgi:hypothetical protein
MAASTETMADEHRSPSRSSNQLMRNVAFAHQWAAQRQLSLVRVPVAIVDAPRGASGLRAHVAAFKRLLKPDVCGRLGVVSDERVADLLDPHDEGGLASWVRSPLAATRR